MVKVLFVGPSLAGADYTPGDIEIRPPAAHGDILRAVLEGATAIGLVDGLFDAVAAVWHKEILYALSTGVAVLGAASMGALRAAECAEFGMWPVGDIALNYLSGERDDDADVGLVHAPAELGWLPLTEPIVDIEATLAKLGRLGLLRGVKRPTFWPMRAPSILLNAASTGSCRRSWLPAATLCYMPTKRTASGRSVMTLWSLSPASATCPMPAGRVRPSPLPKVQCGVAVSPRSMRTCASRPHNGLSSLLNKSPKLEEKGWLR